MEAGGFEPKRPLSQTIQNHNKTATDCNEKASGGGFAKQARALPGHGDNTCERELGANMVREISDGDADLAEVVTAWPQLPDATRSAILAIVRAAADNVRE